jgi:hypothetical protein
LLPRLLAALRPNATVVAGAMAEAAVRVVDAMVVASAVVDVTAAVAVVVVNTAVVISSAAMAAVNRAPMVSDSRLRMVIAVRQMLLVHPAKVTTPLTEARAKPAHVPTINVTTLLVVATVVQASNLAASVAVVVVSVVAPVAVAPPADADESSTPTVGVLSPVACGSANKWRYRAPGDVRGESRLLVR